MRVLICHNSYKNTSGEDLVIATDVSILRERQVKVIEYTRSNNETDDYGLAGKMGFFPNVIYSNRSRRELKLLCTREHPDVALVQNVFPLLSPSVYHALYAAGVPIVQLVYNYRFICPNAILFTKGRVCERCVGGNYFNAVIHKCYRESRSLSALYATALTFHRKFMDIGRVISAYVTPDKFLQVKLSEGGLPRDRMFSILNPFDVEQYTPDYSNRGYFVYFGRIVKEKGIFTLLKGMKELPDSKLVVVGGGTAEQEARDVVHRGALRHVSFTGPQYGEELIEILRGAIAVVVPTEWYDNSPLVVHQAFALGKPVIASDIDGIPEIVEDGKHGLLFPPGDHLALAEKMRRLERDAVLRDRLGRNARSKAEQEFTADRRYEQLMKVIEFARTNTI